MSSLSGILNIARSGLYASQLALQTTSNNIANAGTSGYSRQQVDLVESVPETIPCGQLGTGVTVEGVRRVRDQFLDRQYYQAQQLVGEGSSALAAWQQVESLLNEPSDSGLESSLTGFFGALTDLATYPEDLTTRQAVLEQGETLAADFNRLSNGLASLKENLGSDIEATTDQVNGLAREIADLNAQIQVVQIGGGTPNSLMDSRDLKLDELSKLIGVTTSVRPDGSVTVSLAGGAGLLVDHATATVLTASLDVAGDSYRLSAGQTSIHPQGGSLTALLAARNDSDGAIKSTTATLDELAVGLIGAFNRLQATGAGPLAPQSVTAALALDDPTASLESSSIGGELTLPGSLQLFVYDQASDEVVGGGKVSLAAGDSLDDVAAQLEALGLTATTDGGRLSLDAGAGRGIRFASDGSGLLGALGVGAFFTGENAATIAVSQALIAQPQLVATGAVDPAGGAVGSADNSVALAMAALQNSDWMDGGSATPVEFYAAGVGTVGTRVAALQRSVESHELVRDSVQTQREEVSGVSLDEEMVSLIQFQRAFQASSKVVQMTDELLSTIVNGLLS